MKRVIVYLLVFTIMGASIHIDEFAKLPMLFSHYFEHKKQHPTDTTFDFLYKHYVLNQAAESANDKSSDAQLPFKSTHSFQSHFTPFVCENKKVIVLIELGQITYLPISVSKAFTCSLDIWQPPQL